MMELAACQRRSLHDCLVFPIGKRENTVSFVSLLLVLSLSEKRVVSLSLSLRVSDAIAKVLNGNMQHSVIFCLTICHPNSFCSRFFSFSSIPFSFEHSECEAVFFLVSER